MSNDDKYQDLGLDDVAPMQMSELSVEAQAQQAFHQMAPESLRSSLSALCSWGWKRASALPQTALAAL